jgi:hypothetical protein
VITLLGVYFGTYSAMLQPVVVVEEGWHGMVVSGCREPHFRAGDAVLQFAFAPLVWIDQLVRPNYWNEFSHFDP